MKTPFSISKPLDGLIRSLTLAVGLALTASAPAAPIVLLTDNYTGTGTPDTFNLNFNLGGRQTGTLAPVTYTLNPGGNCQVGNVGEPHDGGNVLLCAFGSNAALDHNFNGVNSAGGLRISFDLDPNSHVDHTDLMDWGAITLGSSFANRNTFVVSGTPHFGVLFRANGHIQAFDGGTVVSPNPEPNWLPDGNYSGQLHRFDIVCSDADGNPFDGSGNTTIEVFVDGGMTPVYSFTKVGGYADNHINLQGSFIVDFENLSIIQPNPPGSPPVFARQPQNQCVAAGLSVTLNVAVSGSPEPTLKWQKNGVDIGGATSSTLAFAPVSASDAGNYRVVATNPAGSATSSVARVAVGLAMNNPSFEADTFSVFPGYVSGNGPITGWNSLGNHGINPGVGFSPFADNGTIPHGSQVAFMQGNGSMNQIVSGFTVGGVYYVQYSENSRVGDSPTDPAVELKIGGVTVLAAHAVPPVGGSNPYRSVASDPFTATATDLEIAFIKSDPQGADNTVLVDNVCIVAVGPTDPPFITAQPQDQTVNVCDPVSFSVGAVGGLPLSYRWRKGGTDIGGATNATFTIDMASKLDEGDYSAVVSNANGSVTSRVARLTVFEPIPGLFNSGVDASGNALPAGALDPHYTIFVNPDSASPDAFVHIEGFPIAPAGPWLQNNAVSKWISPRADTGGAAGGDYTYRASFTLTDRDPTTVIIQGRWSTDNAGLNIFVNGTPTGLVNGGQFAVWTDFTLDSANATFVNGLNTIDFQLNNAGLGFTGLRVEIFKSNARINPGVPPTFFRQPSPQLTKLAEGDSVTFSGKASGSAPITYQWKKNGVNLPGETRPMLSLTNVTSAANGSYTLSAMNPAGTAVSDAVIVCVCWRPLAGLFGTGVDDLGQPLADAALDPHYQMTVSADQGFSFDAYVVNEAWPIAPLGPWVASGPRSRWIAPRPEQDQIANPTFGNAEGNYTFQTTFDLTGVDPAQVRLRGQWAVDNLGLDILLNGVSTGITSPGFVSYTPFTITSGFVPGINTLDFLINNLPTTPNPVGLRVDLQGLVNLQPHLSIARSGGQVIVTWSPASPCQTLQSATVIGGPWQPVVGATSPHQAAPGGTAKFFRVAQ